MALFFVKPMIFFKIACASFCIILILSGEPVTTDLVLEKWSLGIWNISHRLFHALAELRPRIQWTACTLYIAGGQRLIHTTLRFPLPPSRHCQEWLLSTKLGVATRHSQLWPSNKNSNKKYTQIHTKIILSPLRVPTLRNSSCRKGNLPLWTDPWIGQSDSTTLTWVPLGLISWGKTTVPSQQIPS